MTVPRKFWLLSSGSLEGTLLGPMLRTLEILRQAKIAGTEAVLLLESLEQSTEFDSIIVQPLTSHAISQIHPGDAVLASAHLHPKHILRLINAAIPFDLDLYSLVPYEHLELKHAVHPLRVFQSRKRYCNRYRILLERAEKIYISNPSQINFLGGMLFGIGTASASKLASRLPESCIHLPMGCHPTSPSSSFPNPYPDILHERPIFLWGGGIWSWFDINTLIEAFKILHSKNSPAVLFFLAKGNPSGISFQDAPAKQAFDLAKSQGLLDSNVFFANSKIGQNELPGYLENCYAGIMANPERLESYGSWRTRILDLIAYGRPLVTSGYDPISRELQLKGACITSKAGDPLDLARAIELMCRPEQHEATSNQMMSIRMEYDWYQIFSPFRDRLADSTSFRKIPLKIPLIQQFQFIAGI